MPEGIGVVDLMIGFPHRDRRAVYDYLRKGAKDAESKDMTFLAEYMFKDVPDEVDEDRKTLTSHLAARELNNEITHGPHRFGLVHRSSLGTADHLDDRIERSRASA